MQDVDIHEQLSSLLESGKAGEFRRLVREMDPADVADLVEDLRGDTRERAFAAFDPGFASEVLAEIDAPQPKGRQPLPVPSRAGDTGTDRQVCTRAADAPLQPKCVAARPCGVLQAPPLTRGLFLGPGGG